EAVSLTDIAPTILRAAGVAPPAAMNGRDLLGPPAKQAKNLRDLYSETEYPRVAGWSPLRALTDGRWTTISAGGANLEVYDLANDAGQMHNLAQSQASIAGTMSSRIEAIQTSAGGSAARVVSAEAEERLRALGYVAGSSTSAAQTNAPNPAGLI